MIKLLNNKYLLYAILCVLLVGVALTFSVRTTQTASADYESDYLNNPQAIVNYNQYIQFTDTSSNITKIDNNSFKFSTLSSSGYVNCVVFKFIQNHKYYIKSNFTDNKFLLRNNSTDVHFVNSDNILNFTYEDTNINNLYVFSNATAGTYYLSVIDLTQMFGANSDNLTLEQCKQLFTADYYTYSTGNSMPFSGYEAYNLGVIDTLNSYNNFSVNLSAISSAFIDNSLNNSNAFVKKFYEPSNTDYSYYLQARGYLSIPFNTTIDNGSLISFKYYDPGQGGSGNYLWCGVYNQNSFYPVMFIGNLTGETITFASPVSTQYLLFADSSTQDYFTFSDSAYWLGDFVVDNAKFDMNALLDSARTNAYAEKEQYYLTYYGENGTGYNAIYNSGYQTGINAQLSEAGRHFYTFPQFLGALFDVPVKTITSLLDFDVLGFNLKNFFFSLITLSIVFAIIKFILVRTGDK